MGVRMVIYVIKHNLSWKSCSEREGFVQKLHTTLNCLKALQCRQTDVSFRTTSPKPHNVCVPMHNHSLTHRSSKGNVWQQSKVLKILKV